jgi:hypothetical protein
MAKSLRCQTDSLRKALSGHDVVSASLALRMARLAQVGVDDMLAGKYPIKGMCPHCGNVTERSQNTRVDSVKTNAEI